MRVFVHPRFVTIATLLLGASFLGACGGAARTAPNPQALIHGRSVQALLPPDTRSVGYINAEEVRRTELYEVIGRDFDNWTAAIEAMGDEDTDESEAAPETEGAERAPAPQGTEGEGETSEDEDEIGYAEWSALFERVKWTVFANARPNREEEDANLVIVAMELAEDEVARLLRGLAQDEEEVDILIEAEENNAPARATPTLERRTHQGRKMWVYGEHSLASLSDDVWVYAPPERVTALLERAYGSSEPTPPARTDALVRQLGLFDHQIGLVVGDLDFEAPGLDQIGEIPMVGSALVAPEESSEEEPSPELDWLDAVQGVGLAVDLSGTVSVEMLAATASTASAQRVEVEVRRQMEEAIAEQTLIALDIPHLISQISLRREENNLRATLDLSEREAHLWWGRISGAVGAAIVVVGILASMFRGFGAALGEGMDTDFSVNTDPRQLRGTVTAASPGGPVTVGNNCVIDVRVEDTGGSAQCHARLECAEKILYGPDDTSGYFEWCNSGPTGDPFIIGNDVATTAGDGDAMVLLDSVGGTVEVSDDDQGPYGAYDLTIQLEAP
ncbi:MAG: hypothetical protein AAGF12_22390 [Myxococcota bacterium]